MTAREFLTKSMQLVGIIGSGDVMSAEESSDALISFNDLLESWSTEGLMIPATVRETFNLIANKAAYTIGVGGNFNTSRPMQIVKAGIIQTGSSPELEIPMRIYNIQEWAEISGKNQTSEFPVGLYYEPTAALATINLFPVPSIANKISLYSLKPLAAIASLDTVLDMPPGYNRSLRFNMAQELSAEYGKTVSQHVANTAAETKSLLMRLNTKESVLSSDYSGGSSTDRTTAFKMGN